jgi:hypothetical protein
MPQDTAYVTLQKNGKVIDFPRENLIKAKALGWAEVKSPEGKPVEPSLLDVFGTETARGMGFDPDKIRRMGRTPEGKTKVGMQAVEMGNEMAKGIDKWLGATIKDPFHAIDPLHALASGVESGVGGVYKVLTETDRNDPKLLEKLVGAGGRLTGGLANVAAGVDVPERIGEIPGDLKAGAKSVAEVPGKAVKATVRNIAERGPTQVRAAEAAANKDLANYEMNANQARVAARAAHEAGEAKKAAEYEAAAKKWEDAAKQESAKSRGAFEAERTERAGELKETRKKYQQDLAEKRGTEAENAKIEATEKVLKQKAQTGTQELTQNLKNTLDKANESFDAEFKATDKLVETVQTKITPAVEAVLNAQKNIIEGTPENIKQFQSILTKGTKDSIDIGGGKIMDIVSTATVPGKYLRGIIRELNSKIYDGSLQPDVRAAMKSVVEAGNKELYDAIGDVHGKSAVNTVQDLNSRYSDYLTDWRDTSSTNPLPKVRNILLERVTTRNPEYPAYLDVGRILKGANAQKAMVLLEKYKKFGADPKILAEYQKTLEQLGELPKPKKVPEVEAPKYPERMTEAKVKIPKPPEKPEATPMAKIDYPERPKAFDPQQFIKEGVSKRMHTVGNLGMGWAFLSFLTDLIHGNVGSTLTMAERLAVMQGLKSMLTSERFLNWVSKEAPARAKGVTP